ncbi:MAG TPA: hypothetical protein VGM56_08775 [Byssovorax sp.]
MSRRALVVVAGALAIAAWAGCSVPGPTTLVIGGASSTDATAAATGAGGAGGSTATGVTPGAAKAFFISTVYPDLAVTPVASGDATTCATCHAPPGVGPAYLAADAESSYATIVAFPGFVTSPDDSELVVYGSVQHTGPPMNATQLADVTQWLELEVAERSGGSTATASSTSTTAGTGAGGSDPNAGITLTQALTRYGQCMDFGIWQSPGASFSLTDLSATVTSSGPCFGCHEDGLYGNWLSDDAQETFAKNQTMPYVTRQVSGENNPDGSFKRLVPARRWILKGSEICSPGQTLCHPQYAMTADEIDAIDGFVTQTIARFESGDCSPTNLGSGGGGGAGGSP